MYRSLLDLVKIMEGEPPKIAGSAVLSCGTILRKSELDELIKAELAEAGIK